MIVNASSAQSQAAFKVLVDIVERWNAEGRLAYGASLKPELQTRTANAFDEKQLGFMTFQQFLRAAADEGLVDLHAVPNAPDVNVVPKGQAPQRPLEAGSSVPSGHVPRIRQDLWKAFVDWSPTYERFYDRAQDVAYRVPATESELEGGEIKMLRREREKNPERFVAIEPVSMETQLDWMRRFVADQRPEVQIALLPALDGARPLRDFSLTVRRTPEAAVGWQRARLQRVREAIEAWASDHRVVLDMHATSNTQHGRPAPESGRSPAALNEKLLRDRIHSAVDAMSVSELLDLPIRARHIVDVGI